jgi:methionine aminopeptidase
MLQVGDVFVQQGNKLRIVITAIEELNSVEKYKYDVVGDVTKHLKYSYNLERELGIQGWTKINPHEEEEML